MPKKSLPPDRILSYFQTEGKVLAIITASGLVYNLGLLAGPWFEGRMAETLVRILQKNAVFSDMLVLVCGYIAATALVQGMRYVKRFYVRRFANNVNRRMKEPLYGNLVRKSRRELEQEVAAMPDGTATRVGTGGQAQRLALARPLCHKRPLLVLDDPFSALDRSTEAEIFQKLRQAASGCAIVLISHRLYLFPQLDQVIWMENGHASVGTHQELLNTEPA